MLADAKSGVFLGLKGRPVSGMGGAGPVYRVKETQEWILKKTEGGYTISQVVVTGMEAYWFEDGDTIQTTYGPKHTWVFQPVPDISMT
ncbi:hypothetical protein AZE42_11567 [Rhizopogon vesiculosus]|uniref:Uncharacterized protein n=1 Tax=Rhizopogon vesiculosus TaxID=180088 RepID=A0A1J8PTG4_9AGAM|nr:hypothetical protein AZE42_11567 [Rhizopogon vesiculosus]